MRIGLLIVILSGLIISSCGYDSFKEYKPIKKPQIAPTMDIGELKALYRDAPIVVKEEIFIAGTVTANDYSGNFYRTFIIEDETGAVEIKAGLYNLHNRYGYNRKIAVSVKALTIGSYQGVLQIGLASPEVGAFEVDYFGYMSIMEQYVSVSDEFLHKLPKKVTIENLNQSLCGRLIEIEGVTLTDDQKRRWASSIEEGQQPETGHRIFESTDNPESQIVVNTSGYADFASAKIPMGRLSIKGILLFDRVGGGKQRYMIKMRNEDDCKVL